MRMDSGFWSARTIRACLRHRIRCSITVRQTKPIRSAIAAIDEQAWVEIVHPEGGLAQVAETRYQGDRLIVRRTRLVGAQAELFPIWRYHAVVTDRVGTTAWLDQDHRRHAVVELCNRDLKAGVGLRHCPAGPTRPRHPLRQAMDAPPARGLALGTMIRAGPGPAALPPLRHLTGTS